MEQDVLVPKMSHIKKSFVSVPRDARILEGYLLDESAGRDMESESYGPLGRFLWVCSFLCSMIIPGVSHCIIRKEENCKISVGSHEAAL